MTSSLNISWHGLSFSAVTLREIMDNPLDGETASARLKEVGLMSVLYYMHVGNKALTLANITEETGLTRGGVYETVEFLLKRGLLRETEVKNSLGRGRARQFAITSSIFDRIRQFEKNPRRYTEAGADKHGIR
jgi:hypothetical protein